MKYASFFAGLLACTLVLVGAATACPAVPKFSGRIERSALPARPPFPVRQGNLESYRVDWETAREVIIEGYNRRLNAYNDRLLRTDYLLREELKLGSCKAEEAGEITNIIAEYLELIRTDYRFDYDEPMKIYFSEVNWYRTITVLLRQCRALGGCKNGYPS